MRFFSALLLILDMWRSMRSLFVLFPSVYAKAEKLIAQHASESYKDREAATKELLKMGKGTIPLLKKHLTSPDPEVRQRIEDILRQTDPKKAEPVPPPDIRQRGGLILTIE